MTGPEGEGTKNVAEVKVDTEKQLANLRASGVQPGENTASGVALTEKGQLEIGGEEAEHFGEAGEGADEVGEDTILKPGKAHGKQLEPAIMTPSGTVPAGFIPSPSGPVPAGVIADERTRKTALNRVVKQHNESRGYRKNSRMRLSEEEIAAMSPAQLRAVGDDRGYDMPDTGRARIRNAFTKAQEDDDTLEGDRDGLTATQATVQQPIPVPGTAAAATTTEAFRATDRSATPPKGGPATNG